MVPGVGVTWLVDSCDKVEGEETVTDLAIEWVVVERGEGVALCVVVCGMVLVGVAHS